MKICYLRFVRLGRTIGYTDTLDLVRYMSQAGHKAFFVVMNGKKDEKWTKRFCSDASFLKVPSMPGSRGTGIDKLVDLILYTVFSLILLVRLHLKEKIDFVHFYPETAIPVLIFSCIFRDVRMIFDLRKPILIQATEIGAHHILVPFTVAFYILSEKLSLVYSDAIIAISKGVEFYLRKRMDQYKIKHEKDITIIPSIVDLSVFKPEGNNELVKALKAENGVEPYERVLLYVGSASAVRDFDKILMAFCSVLANGYAAKLLILGFLDRKTEARIDTLKLRDDVIIRYVPHPYVPRYIEMADVCLSYLPEIPTYKYSSPMKVLEYMAMGKPVVATDIFAHRELIVSGATGILTECTEDDFARGIMHLLNNPDQTERMAEEARHFVERNLSLEAIGLRYQAFLGEVSHERKRVR